MRRIKVSMIVPGNARPRNYMEIMYGLYGERTYFLRVLEVILIYNLTKSSPLLWKKVYDGSWKQVMNYSPEAARWAMFSSCWKSVPFSLLLWSSRERPILPPSTAKASWFLLFPHKNNPVSQQTLCPSHSNSKAKLNCCVDLPGRIGADDQKWPPTTVARARLAHESKPDLGILMKWSNFLPPAPKVQKGQPLLLLRGLSM